jgi:hypothetical protein
MADFRTNCYRLREAELHLLQQVLEENGAPA